MLRLSQTESKSLLITGSEDTHLKVSVYDHRTRQLDILQTFNNHVGSVRAIVKVRLRGTGSSSPSHLVITGGSRLEANLFLVEQPKSGQLDGSEGSLGAPPYQMSHLCHFMRSFEQHKSEQDIRIMALSAVQFE
mmetsp:Transcript_13408/g.22832  ORF Transcript_13408/g.22832 Transcript_13408/m.22832 type:complete len:134 (-) Transcript_13408:954-1355(-)